MDPPRAHIVPGMDPDAGMGGDAVAADGAAASDRTALELERSARHLAEVLALAEALPFRRDWPLRFPRLPG